MAKVTKRQLADRFVDQLGKKPLDELAAGLMAAAQEAGWGPRDLPDLQAAVEQSLLDNRGQVHIQLDTAHPVSDAQADAIAARIAQAVDAQNYTLDRNVRPELLGGFEARAGHLAIHNSIQYRLKELEQVTHG